MSELSQAQKNKLNNFLRSLNQRITNFVEELMMEEDGIKGEDELAKKKAEENEVELEELLKELKMEEEKSEKKEEAVTEQKEEKNDEEGGVVGANALLDKVLQKTTK